MHRKPLRSDAKRHHLVPQSYMRRFSIGGRRIYVFDNATMCFAQTFLGMWLCSLNSIQ